MERKAGTHPFAGRRAPGALGSGDGTQGLAPRCQHWHPEFRQAIFAACVSEPPEPRPRLPSPLLQPSGLPFSLRWAPVGRPRHPNRGRLPGRSLLPLKLYLPVHPRPPHS
jgi:hypothetical protein